MSRHYTPLKTDYSLFYERRAAMLHRKLEGQKWEDSRQSAPRKTRRKNRSTLEAMRSVVKAERRKNTGCPVCINLRHLVSCIPPVQSWRYLDECNKVFFYQLALERAEATDRGTALTPFTFNASDTLVDAFYSQKKNLADYLRDRFTKSLKQALGRPIPFYFIIETAGAGKLHLHGSMLIAEHEQAQVKLTLEKVNRQMIERFLTFGLDSRQAQINRYGNLYATLHWSNYITKEYRLNRIAYSLNTLTAASAPMTTLAKEYHADFRRLQKRSKSPVTY